MTTTPYSAEMLEIVHRAEKAAVAAAGLAELQKKYDAQTRNVQNLLAATNESEVQAARTALAEVHEPLSEEDKRFEYWIDLIRDARDHDRASRALWFSGEFSVEVTVAPTSSHAENGEYKIVRNSQQDYVLERPWGRSNHTTLPSALLELCAHLSTESE